MASSEGLRHRRGDTPDFLDEQEQEHILHSLREESTRQNWMLSNLLLALTFLAVFHSLLKSISTHPPLTAVLGTFACLSSIPRAYHIRPKSKLLKNGDVTWTLRILGGLGALGVVLWAGVEAGWGKWVPLAIWGAVSWGEYEKEAGEGDLKSLEEMKYELKGA